MIVRCNPKCKNSDGFTDGSLDVDSNEVVCNECGDILKSVSSYAKLSMKTTGDIIRSKYRKAFMFPCQACDTNVEAQFVNGVLVGKACSNNQVGCKINVTEHMVKAIEETQNRSEKVEADESE
jgi:hypothetical protein